MTLRAIETLYAGCRFRSRTEARWAVFFSVLGLSWSYELEGFRLPAGGYLPDFWLRGCQWAEVKGARFTRREDLLVQQLATASGREVIKLIGAPEHDRHLVVYPASWDRDAICREHPFHFAGLGEWSEAQVYLAIAEARSARFEPKR